MDITLVGLPTSTRTEKAQKIRSSAAVIIPHCKAPCGAAAPSRHGAFAAPPLRRRRLSIDGF